MRILLSKADSRILWLLKILLGLCLLTPLLMSASFLFPYTSPKAFAFRILVELAAVGYFYLALKYPENFFTPLFKGGRGLPASAYDIRRWQAGGILSLSVLVFLIISLFSAFFGADFYTSFWGNLERGIGLFGLLHFIVFFFLLSAVFSIDSDKNKTPPFLKGGWGGFKGQSFSRQLIIVSVLTSALISLLAICQHFFSLSSLLPQSDRVYSLIGNAGILGSYLIFNIFLAGYLLLISFPSTGPMGGNNKLSERNAVKSKTGVFLYSLFIILNSFALALTGTRGAWLGLAVGVVVFLVLLAITPLFYKDHKSIPPFLKGGEGGFKEFKKWPIIVLAAIFILFAGLFLARDTALVKNNSVLSRVASISLKDATIQSRLFLWQGARQAWQERPLFGFGPENFSVAANRYFDPRLAGREAYGFDRAHNFIFDYGVTSGWLGLLSYLGLMVVAGWYLFRIAKCWITQRTSVILLGSLLTAYLVQNLFIFDTFVSYLMLFFVLALVSNMSLRAPSEAEGHGNPAESETNMRLPRRATPLEQSSAPRNDNFSVFKKMAFLLAVICLLFFVYCYNIKPMLASYRANQILSLSPAGATKASQLLASALALKTFASPEIVYQTSIDYLTKIDQAPSLAESDDFYKVAVAELKKVIARSPSQARNYVALAWLDLYFSNQYPSGLDEAISLANKIKELSPTKKDAYLILVADYALRGDKQLGERVVIEAQQISPIIGEDVRKYWEKIK